MCLGVSFCLICYSRGFHSLTPGPPFQAQLRKLLPPNFCYCLIVLCESLHNDPSSSCHCNVWCNFYLWALVAFTFTLPPLLCSLLFRASACGAGHALVSHLSLSPLLDILLVIFPMLWSPVDSRLLCSLVQIEFKAEFRGGAIADKINEKTWLETHV